MRTYPRNSPQAASRILALTLLADGHFGGAPEGLSDLIIAAATEVRKAGGCKVC